MKSIRKELMVSLHLVNFTKMLLVKYKNIMLCSSKKIAKICSLSTSLIAQSVNTNRRSNTNKIILLPCKR